MKTDHWFYGLFQSAPDQITLLLPAAGAAPPNLPADTPTGPPAPSLAADAPGNALYRFEAPELKSANHRLDGALWPRGNERGTPEQPVVLLEVQMHAKADFKHRQWAQTARFTQLHPRVQHLEVVAQSWWKRAPCRCALRQRSKPSWALPKVKHRQGCQPSASCAPTSGAGFMVDSARGVQRQGLDAATLTPGHLHTPHVALNIRNAEADRLAAEVASLAGETKTLAVIVALKERRQRLQHQAQVANTVQASLVQQLDQIGLRCASRAIRDSRSPEAILGYDATGLPS